MDAKHFRHIQKAGKGIIDRYIMGVKFKSLVQSLKNFQYLKKFNSISLKFSQNSYSKCGMVVKTSQFSYMSKYEFRM